MICGIISLLSFRVAIPRACQTRWAFVLCVSRVVFVCSPLVILSFFSSQGWESWNVEHRPLIPERMPVLVDDDLRFEDGPTAARPAAVVNRWLRELPASGVLRCF